MKSILLPASLLMSGGAFTAASGQELSQPDTSAQVRAAGPLLPMTHWVSWGPHFDRMYVHNRTATPVRVQRVVISNCVGINPSQCATHNLDVHVPAGGTLTLLELNKPQRSTGGTSYRYEVFIETSTGTALSLNGAARPPGHD